MIRIVKENKKEVEIRKYLIENNEVFSPNLSLRVNIVDFSIKLSSLAEQWWVLKENEPIGFMACYFNDPNKLLGYITTISVVKEYQGKGFGAKLLTQCFNYGRFVEFNKIRLEVNLNNTNAIDIYKKYGFEVINKSENNFIMEKILIEPNY